MAQIRHFTFDLKILGITAVSALVSLLMVSPAFAAVSISHEYPVPTPGSQPGDITTGSDGNLWFTENAGNKIAKITPSGVITEYTIPTANSGVMGIAAGTDGNLWFTEETANKIGKITPSGTITEYDIPVSSSNPLAITSGNDGNMWFTANAATNSALGRITPSGTITLYPTPTSSSGPSAISVGPNGAMWFTETTANKIGTMAPGGSTITEYPVPTGITSPSSIAWGPGNYLWFGGSTAEIAKTDINGAMTAYPISSGHYPTSMAYGPDDNIWFTEAAGYVGTVTASGSITEYQIPTASSQPNGLVMGPDDNMWFTEQLANKIGYVSGISAQPVTVTLPGVQISAPAGTRPTCYLISPAPLFGNAWPKLGSSYNYDAGYQYPLGFVNLCLDSPIINNRITMTFPTALPASDFVARDYNVNTNTYTTIPGAAITSTNYNGQPAVQLAYTLTDNGPLDSNASYGAITDPVGLAVAITPDTGLARSQGSNLTLPLMALSLLLVTSGAILVLIAARSQSAS